MMAHFYPKNHEILPHPRVFQFSGSVVDEGQSATGLGGMSAQGSGLVGGTAGYQQMNGRVAKSSQNLRGRAGPDTALILPECHVAHMKEAVLDPPMSPAQVQKFSRVGSLTRKLVIPYATSLVVSPRIVLSRSNRKACSSPGQSL